VSINKDELIGKDGEFEEVIKQQKLDKIDKYKDILFNRFSHILNNKPLIHDDDMKYYFSKYNIVTYIGFPRIKDNKSFYNKYVKKDKYFKLLDFVLNKLENYIDNNSISLIRLYFIKCRERKKRGKTL